jgi:hypothetical protein
VECTEIKKYIESKLKKNLPSSIFLSGTRFVDEVSRANFVFNDNTFVPFYYWLGTVLKPTSVVEVGFGLGVTSSNFFKSCKSTNYFLALQEPKSGEYYSSRLGKANIKDHYKKKFNIYVGLIQDDAFSTQLKSRAFDLAIINEETTYDRYRLFCGFLIVDCVKKHRVAGMAFKDFCTYKHLDATYINTTYGVGIIKKLER